VKKRAHLISLGLVKRRVAPRSAEDAPEAPVATPKANGDDDDA
jgi:hypothetical protein